MLKLKALALIFISTTYLAPTTSLAKRIDQDDRKLFKVTYEQVKAGDFEAARPALHELKDYPLYPWLEYEHIKQHIDTTPNQDIQSFVQRHPHTVMSDQLYLAWAKKLASKQDWSVIRDQFPKQYSHTLDCYRATALIKTKDYAQGSQILNNIWQGKPKNLSKTCVSALGQLKGEDKISNDTLWQRIKAAMHKNEVTYAGRLAQHLPAEKQKLFEHWVKARKQPKTHLPKLFELEQSPELMDIVTHGLERAALKKLGDALTLWDQAQKHFTFTEAERGYVESELGMWEAWRQKFVALKRFRDIPAEHRTDKGNEWMARIALRYQQWNDVLDAVNAMSPELAKDNTWQYWKAHALKETGKTQEANQIFTQLAHNATYYGFLAADQLGQAYPHVEATPPNRSQRIQGIKKLATYERWQEWQAQGRRDLARKEWFRLLKAMDKDGVLAAAETAKSSGDANLAIWTVSRAKDWNAVDLRFPMKYEQLVMNSAQEQGIRPEWVYGVMRRESAFDDQAMSHVKALGLMQLMPATARQVARKMRLPVKTRQEILQPKNNVQLGSAYLKEMLGRFSGDYIRATAAYNAGPGRIPKWSPYKPMPAEQWVESIPFKETRSYVRAVMAYTTIYDHKLNEQRSQRLSSRLKPIVPSE